MGHTNQHSLADKTSKAKKMRSMRKMGAAFKQKRPLGDQQHPHLPLKGCPLPLSNPPCLWSRCIVGRKVVAIRPLRGLRGRSENPEIHYAFKTFIYFRITYILSPGGPKRRKRNDDGSISFGEINSLQLQYLFVGGRYC